MRWRYKLPLRLRSLFHRNKAELDLREELQFHLQNQIDEYGRKAQLLPLTVNGELRTANKYLPRVEVNVLNPQVPMPVEDLEAALLLFLEQLLSSYQASAASEAGTGIDTRKLLSRT